MSPNTPSGLRLWRTGAHKFRVIEYGEPADMLTNYDYILIDRKYEEVLRSTGPQLQLTSVTITDEVRKLVWHNYLEATIQHSVSRNEIIHASPLGLVIYRYGEQDPSVFVSDALKASLQQVEGHALEFSLGLSLFAG
ncbi:hypothetical protein [Hymenobacter sp. HDW8]|uniref:hypothetical protein n=1 Tax=Hymenobacter sp. HDW8 TaxID=2714932 RepID=UPI00140B06FF|nr:hypothetical protein [Hymenobacter sp. HDW8]QIL77575.1 hypothetical protein G7064_18300 [Hymenobacter sp. HDW8]